MFGEIWKRPHRKAETRTGPKIYLKFAKQNREEEDMQRDRAVISQPLGKSSDRRCNETEVEQDVEENCQAMECGLHEFHSRVLSTREKTLKGFRKITRLAGELGDHCNCTGKR